MAGRSVLQMVAYLASFLVVLMEHLWAGCWDGYWALPEAVHWAEPTVALMVGMLEERLALKLSS